MEVIAGPAIAAKPERHCVGIRVVTPFRGMFAVRDDEAYLTDPRSERMRTRRRIELAVRLVDRLS